LLTKDLEEKRSGSPKEKRKEKERKSNGLSFMHRAEFEIKFERESTEHPFLCFDTFKSPFHTNQ
jgi:hypothetical protein